MRFKQVLSAALVTSFIFPTMLPSLSYGQNTSGLLSSSNDAIDMILEAMVAKSPAEARALLTKAQEKANAEKLPPETMAKIKELLAEASNELKLTTGNNPLAGAAPQSISVGGKAPLGPVAQAPQASSTQAPDIDAIVAKLMTDNPDLHSTIVQIGIGRLQRDSSNLDEIVQANTLQSITAVDTASAITNATLGAPGEVIKALRTVGFFHDWPAINKALRANHESIPVDVLARHMIEKASEVSVLAGAVKKLGAFSGIKYGAGTGVTLEAIANYGINADLVIGLSDLYGMNLTESQQNVAILAIVPLAKFLTLTPGEKTTDEAIAAKEGELFAQAKASSNPNAMARFYTVIFASPFMAILAKKVGLGSQLEAAKSKLGKASAIQTPTAPPVAQTVAPAVAPPVAAAPLQPIVSAIPEIPVQIPGIAAGTAGPLDSAIAKAEAAAVSAGEALAPAASIAEGAAGKIAEAPLNWKVQAALLFKNALLSGAETVATGILSMAWFKHEKQKSVEIETADFHSYLMSDQSRGFFKLLIATLNVASTHPPVIDIRKSNDPRVAFIMNIARSVRICSPAESARFIALQKQQKGTAISKIQNLADKDYQLLRFQCDANLGFGRYKQIAKEFMTLNAIPEWEVADLRTASYSSRVQMGQLLMQLQFLGGEPNDDQNKFFRTTLSKILGLTRLDDAKYFRNFYAFIRERGGMMANVSSPTGYSIMADKHNDPYANSVTYTAPGGPEMLSPPSEVPVTTPPGVAAPGTPGVPPAGPGGVHPTVALPTGPIPGVPVPAPAPAPAPVTAPGAAPTIPSIGAVTPK